MKAFNLTDLEYLSTEQLDEILQEETAKHVPDDDLVLKILRILQDREKDDPVKLTPQEIAALNRYRERAGRRKKKRLSLQRWITAAASVAIVAGLLFSVVPQQAEAETFWEMLRRWSESVLSFLDRDETLVELDYVFETDNPGLQQVYNAVVELGVTEPVVPMWLPDGYELIERDVKKTPMLVEVWSVFASNTDDFVYKVTVYEGEPAHQYYKDDSHYESYEKNGTVFNIARNIDNWVVVWSKDNIECTITIDCHEDALRRILESIYVMEEN